MIKDLLNLSFETKQQSIDDPDDPDSLVAENQGSDPSLKSCFVLSLLFGVYLTNMYKSKIPKCNKLLHNFS